MKDRRFWGLLVFVCLLPVLLAAVQQPAAPPGGTPAPGTPGNTAPGTATRTPAVVLDGTPLPVPVTIAPAGPMFGLRPLAQSLGGELAVDETGESVSLRIADTEVVLGPGSAIVTVGEEIVSLSQPITGGASGTDDIDLLVPLDFLQKTYGDLMGFAFDWRPETARLVVSRRQARDVNVLVDVVHLQGMTTVVLQFAVAPRYDIVRQPGVIEVRMLDDRLAAPIAPPAVQDPLVQSVAVAPEGVRIQLATGAAAQSYILENPFRLVFDVHQPSAVTAPGPSTVPTRPRAPGVRTIVIDPGHGGTESGAVGASGALEKNLTLTIARELEARLESSLGVSVALTRNDDVTIPHDTRVALANQNKADLFISLHLNSSLGAGAHGAETYFLSREASDARAALSAATENTDAAGSGEGPELQDLQLILWDLAQSYHLSESQRFAAMIQAELNQALQLRDRGVKQAPFRVLMGAAMPAVLVELGFISNPEEEKKLQDAAYRAELVGALTRAVGRYKALVENRPLPDQSDQPGQPGAPGGGAQPGAAQPPGGQPAQPGAVRPSQPARPAPSTPPGAQPDPASPSRPVRKP